MTAGPIPLKQLLRRSGGFGVSWFALGSTGLLDVALGAGPEAIVLDLQHGLWDRVGLEAALGLASGTSALARVADGSATAIGQALDAGAAGVLVPLVETAEQARAAIAAAHYPPRGQRSGGGVRPLARGFAAYVGRAAETVVGVMIETAAGIANAESIAATPDLDFVFIGTGDLALSLGCFPEADARHEAACDRVLAACRAAGMPCGIFTTGAAEAARRRRQGYAMVVVANDIGVAAAGFAAAQASFDGDAA